VERNTYRTVVLVITLIRNSPLIEMKTLIACVVLCYCTYCTRERQERKEERSPAPSASLPSRSPLSHRHRHRKKSFFRCFSRRPRLRSAPKLLRLFRYLSIFFFPRCSLFARSFLIRGPQGTLHHSNTHHTLSLVPHVLYHTVSYRTTMHTVCTGCNCNCQCVAQKARWARATANLKRDVQYLYSPMSRTYRTARTGTPHNCARLEPGLPLKDLSLSARVKVRLCPMSILVFSFCEKWVPGFVVRSDALQYVASMTVDDDGFVGFCDTCDGGWRWIGWDWNLTGSGIESLEF
jgi:hypothetical protein